MPRISRSPSRMHDVAVVGGGPGGLYVAQLLASANVDVALFEEHPTSGRPGALHRGGRARSLRRIHAASRVRAECRSRRSGFSAIRPNRRTHDADVEALAIDRLLFDRMLSASAGRAGADRHWRQRVTDVDVHPARVRLTLGDGSVRAARCACSPAARTTRCNGRLGLGMPPSSRSPHSWKWRSSNPATSRCTSAETSRDTGSPGPFRYSGPQAPSRGSG